MTHLYDAPCEPAQPGEDPLTAGEVNHLLSQLADWELLDGVRIRRRWQFPNFQLALEFVNRVGHLAEEAGHHPDISLGWGRVEVELTTHDIGGLHRADFVLAARIDRI